MHRWNAHAKNKSKCLWSDDSRSALPDKNHLHLRRTYSKKDFIPLRQFLATLPAKTASMNKASNLEAVRNAELPRRSKLSTAQVAPCNTIRRTDNSIMSEPKAKDILVDAGVSFIF